MNYHYYRSKSWVSSWINLQPSNSKVYYTHINSCKKGPISFTFRYVYTVYANELSFVLLFCIYKYLIDYINNITLKIFVTTNANTFKLIIVLLNLIVF